jgi:hypothetical protein
VLVEQALMATPHQYLVTHLPLARLRRLAAGRLDLLIAMELTADLAVEAAEALE